MLNQFSGKIREALIERINQTEERVLMADQRIQELTNKINDVLDRIEQNLPTGSRLMFDLDELWVERDVLSYRLMYRQGMLDGMAVNRLIRVIRRSCRE
jgi:hypothetical protein